MPLLQNLTCAFLMMYTTVAFYFFVKLITKKQSNIGRWLGLAGVKLTFCENKKNKKIKFTFPVVLSIINSELYQ